MSGTIAEVGQRMDAYMEVGGRVASGTKTEQLPNKVTKQSPTSMPKIATLCSQ
jgi:hypothetical protein